MIAINKMFLYVLSAGLLMSAVVSSDVHAKKRDPIVGVWLGTVVANETNLYAVGTFNADGTFTIEDTSGIEQPVEGFQSFSGGYGSVYNGIWKKVGNHCYKIVASSLLNTKDTTLRNGCGDLVFPGIPFARTKIEGVLKLGDECQTLQGATLTMSFFAPQDLTLTGEPVRTPITITFFSERLK